MEAPIIAERVYRVEQKAGSRSNALPPRHPETDFSVRPRFEPAKGRVLTPRFEPSKLFIVWIVFLYLLDSFVVPIVRQLYEIVY